MNTEAANLIREIAQTLQRRCQEADPGGSDVMVANLFAVANSLDPRKTRYERKINIYRSWDDDSEFALRWAKPTVQSPDYLMAAWKKQIRMEFDEAIYGGAVSAHAAVVDFHSATNTAYGDWMFSATLTFYYNEPEWRAAHAKAREEDSYYSDRPFDDWLVYAVFGGDEGCVGGGWDLVEEE